MVKKKTSKNPKKSMQNTPKVKLKNEHLLEEYSPTEEIIEGTLIGEAIWECLQNNDPEGVVEMIEIYLNAVNKVKAAKENKLPRSTMYHALKGKNPTIKTLAKMVHCCT